MNSNKRQVMGKLGRVVQIRVYLNVMLNLFARLTHFQNASTEIFISPQRSGTA